MENLDKVLGICCVCNKIRIGDSNSPWLDRGDNPELYDRFIRKYEGRLSHTYCQEHFREASNKINLL